LLGEFLGAKVYSAPTILGTQGHPVGGSLWILLVETPHMQTEDRTSHLLYHFPYPT